MSSGNMPRLNAQVVKLVDTLCSGRSELTLVRVRVSPWAPFQRSVVMVFIPYSFISTLSLRLIQHRKLVYLAYSVCRLHDGNRLCHIMENVFCWPRPAVLLQHW